MFKNLIKIVFVVAVISVTAFAAPRAQPLTHGPSLSQIKTDRLVKFQVAPASGDPRFVEQNDPQAIGQAYAVYANDEIVSIDFK